MRQSTVEMLQCPNCAQPLTIRDVRATGSSEAEVTEAELHCAGCGTAYPVRRGIPNLLTPQLLEDYKKNEMQGWVNLWSKKGMFERPANEDSFVLPYLSGAWQEVARMFEIAMLEMNLKGNEVILDIGAGQGWASRYFAAKGCRVVAIDIVDDEQYGLGRAWAIMERAGVYFEPMLADGERLPFRANTFDYVFFCGALHHFKDFRTVLRQVHTVLKPGGRFIATGEPAISVIETERTVQDTIEETHEGIVERRPKPIEYWRGARQCGFRDVKIDIYNTFRGDAVEIYSWIVALRQRTFESARLRFKPVVWLGLTTMLFLPYRWAGQLTLFASGGNMFIRGAKGK